MGKFFLIKLLLSFVVGGFYIAFTIWVSEKFGSRLGGLFIGLPSTLLISLLFIAWTQNSQAAVAALPVVPATIAANSLFLVAFIYFHKFGRTNAFLAASLLWFALSFPLAFFSLKNILISLGLATIFFGQAIYWLRRFPHRKLERFTLTHKEFLFRVIFSGSFVTLAVLLGKALGPLWGGMFASFPAAFSSSLLLLENKHGINFASSVAKTMPYGSMGNVFFAVTFFLTVPKIGIIYGTVLAYLVSLLFALAINNTVLNKEKEYTAR